MLLDRRKDLKHRLAQSWAPMLDVFGTHLRNMQADDVLLTSLLKSCNDISGLEGRRNYFLTKAVEVPPDAELNPDFRDAIARLVAGKNAFGLPFGKADARRLLLAVTVLASAPKSSEDWQLVQGMLEWRAETRQCIARWNSVASAFGVEPQTGSVETSFGILARLQGRIRDLHDLVFNFDRELHNEFDRVLGKVIADRLWDGGKEFIFAVRESLHVHVDKGRLGYAMNRVDELVGRLQSHRGAIVDDLRSFLTDSLGQADIDESALHKCWLKLQAELSHLSACDQLWTISHAHPT